MLPSEGDYRQPHTRAWSETIAAADGFVFVTPHYNWGYPAPLKNALDHLREEWRGKSAIIVSYGYSGGDKAAAQLRQVLDGLQMRPTPTMPALTLAHEMHDETGRLRDPDAAFAGATASIKAAGRELTALLDETDARRRPS